MSVNNVITPSMLKLISPEAWNRWFNRPGHKMFLPGERVWYADVEAGMECTIVEEGSAPAMWKVKFDYDYTDEPEEVPDEFLFPIRGEENDESS